MDQLLGEGYLILGFVAVKMRSGSADGVTLLIQKWADLPNHQHIMPLIITTITASFYRAEFCKFLLPVTENMGFYSTQLADFTYSEIAFCRITGSSLLLLGSSIRFYPGFKFLTRSECYYTSGGYGYFFACFRISTRTTTFITKFKFSKTGDFYLLTLFQRTFNFFKKITLPFSFASRLFKPSSSNSFSAKSALLMPCVNLSASH